MFDEHLVARCFEQHGQDGPGIHIVVHDHDAQGTGWPRIAIGQGLPSVRNLVDFQARQANPELAALAQARALASDGAVVQFDQCLDQGQPQAQPAGGPVGRAFGLGEQFESPRGQFGGHAYAVIGDFDQYMAIAHMAGQPDMPALGRVLGRIVEKVCQHLYQALAVALNHGRIGR